MNPEECRKILAQVKAAFDAHWDLIEKCAMDGDLVGVAVAIAMFNEATEGMNTLGLAIGTVAGEMCDNLGKSRAQALIDSVTPGFMYERRRELLMMGKEISELYEMTRDLTD